MKAMSAIHDFLDRISYWAARLTGGAMVILAGGLVFSLLISIFYRYVVGKALSWPEEISLMIFAWLTLLAGSLGVRNGFHVRLTLLTSRMPRPAALWLERLTGAAIAAFGGALVYSGMDMLQRTAHHLTPTLRLPLDYVNYSAPVCGALIFLHSLARLAKPEEKEPTQ
jgi:TRAP-type C4-dicarboxylate transport system permease small subunit